MTASWNAAPSPRAVSGWEMSAVARYVCAVPRKRSAPRKGCSDGALLDWLTTPPVEPRPNSDDAGPFRTSTCWRLNGSR